MEALDPQRRGAIGLTRIAACLESPVRAFLHVLVWPSDTARFLDAYSMIRNLTHDFFREYIPELAARAETPGGVADETGLG